MGIEFYYESNPNSAFFGGNTPKEADMLWLYKMSVFWDIILCVSLKQWDLSSASHWALTEQFLPIFSILRTVLSNN